MGRRLYVEGRRVTDVHFEREAGDSLRLNGAALRLAPGARVTRHRLLSDEVLLARYGGIPLFDREMSEGASAIEASRHLHRAKDRLRRVAWSTFEHQKVGGSTALAASEAALEQMRIADVDSLVDWGESPRAHAGEIEIYWREPPPRSVHWISLRTERVSADFAGFSRSEALDGRFAGAVQFYASECPDTCWVFLGRGGIGIAYCGREAIEAVRAQFEHASATGNLGDYPLSPEDVAAVLEESTLPN
jgi:hypothetical protein